MKCDILLHMSVINGKIALLILYLLKFKNGSTVFPHLHGQDTEWLNGLSMNFQLHRDLVDIMRIEHYENILRCILNEMIYEYM